MLAESGEKLDASAAVTMMSRFWPGVKIEYGFFAGCSASRGVPSVAGWFAATRVA